MSQPIFKPRTFNGDLAHLPNALSPLKRLAHWVVWSWVSRTTKGGIVKWTKPPYQIADPSRLAKANDPSTWGKYEDSYPIVEAGTSHGIGFQLSGSYILAVDLDRIRDPMTGEFTPRGKEFINEAANIIGLYREVTVSGAGARFIGLSENAVPVHRKFTLDPATGEAIEFYRNCERYITVSGFLADLAECPVLAPRDDYFETLLARFSSNKSSSSSRSRKSSGSLGAISLDFNDAEQQPQLDYDDLIQNGAPEGERSEKFARVVWYLASQGKSAEEIAEELAQHPGGIGSKYAGRLPAEVARCYGKWSAHKQAGVTGSAAATGGSPWPQIKIIPSELPRVVNEAEEALLDLGLEIYQRGGRLVRPAVSSASKGLKYKIRRLQLIPIDRPYMVEALCCAARFLRYSERKKAWVPTDAPDKIAETLLSRSGNWQLPNLEGIVSTPFLRVDGSLCEQPGYDPANEILFKPDGQSFPPIPQEPTKTDAAAALAKLDKLIQTFPFVTPSDRSVALAGMLTALDRRSMDTAPLIAFTAPAAGTGKSLLVDIIALLATGRRMPVIAQGRTEEELEKRLGAALLAGDVAISIDNCERELKSSLLCQALTQSQLNIRLLGQSRNVETPMNAAFYATGNNLTIASDLTRRVIMGTLDANCERPEMRTFSVDARTEVLNNRPELVAAALTVLRAWHVAKQHEGMTLTPFGSFEEWSSRIREPLVWLGYADPCETVAKVRATDPERDLLVAVIAQWELHLGTGHEFTLQDVIGRAVNEPMFYAALMNIAETRTGGGAVSNKRLGWWLKKVQGKIVNGLSFTSGKIINGYPLWKLHRH